MYLPRHTCMDKPDEGTRFRFITFLPRLLPTLDKNKTQATDYGLPSLPPPDITLRLQKKRISKGGLKEQDERLFITSCKPDCVKCLVLK